MIAMCVERNLILEISFLLTLKIPGTPWPFLKAKGKKEGKDDNTNNNRLYHIRKYNKPHCVIYIKPFFHYYYTLVKDRGIFKQDSGF